MAKGIIKLFALSILSLSLAACSWVEPLPGAHSVTVVKSLEKNQCTKLGTTNTNALDAVGIYQRDEDAIIKDLLMLAKNEAVRMGGDTIIAETSLEKGRMRFGIYRCKP